MSDTRTGLEKAKPALPATVHIESERAVAESKGMIAVAIANPRNQLAAVDRIMAACRRPTLAAAAIYAYPRGGTTVTGPSIRLAEAMAREWGNLSFGLRELSQGSDTSTVQAYCWDLEVNTRAEMTFQVPHTRYSKERGNVRLTDPRDVYELVANQGSRRMRACILRLIPGDIVEMAVEECGKTQEAEMNKGGVPKADRIKNMLAAFEKVGVDRQRLEAYLKHPAADMSNAEILAMGRIYTAIDTEGRKPEEYFPVKKKEGAQDVRASVQEKAQGARGPFGGVFNRGQKGAPEKGKLDAETGERDEPPPEDEGQQELY